MFEEFIDRLVKVVYQDGDTVQVQRGKLVSVENGFIKVVSLKTGYIISLQHIIKMEAENEAASE